MTHLSIDPYFLNQKEICTNINQLKQMLGDREDMLHDPRGINPEVFKNVGLNMQKQIHESRSLLQDIKDSIVAVRSNPSRFQISEVELNNRESFYGISMNTLNDIEAQMNTQTSNQKIQFSFQPVPENSPISGDNFNLPPPSQYQMQQSRQEQIEQLAVAVDEQMELSKMINQTIDEHNKIIIDLDENIDNATTAMKKVTAQINQLIENEGKTPTYLVAVLSLVLIIMLFIVA